MEKLLGTLQKQEIEVTDALKKELQKVWEEETKAIEEKFKETTGNLFTQEELDRKIDSRLARERAMSDGEIKELRGKIEKLVDPEQVEKVKSEFQGQIENLQVARNKDKIDYELRLAATKAGAKDEDYIVFQAEKRGLKDTLEITDQGQIFVKDKKDEKGNPVGVAFLVEELRKELPHSFGEPEKPRITSPGSTNPPPGPGEDPTQEQKRIAAENLAAEMGYKAKKESD